MAASLRGLQVVRIFLGEGLVEGFSDQVEAQCVEALPLRLHFDRRFVAALFERFHQSRDEQIPVQHEMPRCVVVAATRKPISLSDYGQGLELHLYRYWKM